MNSNQKVKVVEGYKRLDFGSIDNDGVDVRVEL
jgi:hypothetical protein